LGDFDGEVDLGGKGDERVFVDRVHRRNLLVRPKDILNNSKNILLYIYGYSECGNRKE
jgi:hypothetical protein